MPAKDHPDQGITRTLFKQDHPGMKQSALRPSEVAKHCSSCVGHLPVGGPSKNLPDALQNLATGIGGVYVNQGRGATKPYRNLKVSPLTAYFQDLSDLMLVDAQQRSSNTKIPQQLKPLPCNQDNALRLMKALIAIGVYECLTNDFDAQNPSQPTAPRCTPGQPVSVALNNPAAQQLLHLHFNTGSPHGHISTSVTAGTNSIVSDADLDKAAQHILSQVR
jgi:hypothetical protein